MKTCSLSFQNFRFLNVLFSCIYHNVTFEFWNQDFFFQIAGNQNKNVSEMSKRCTVKKKNYGKKNVKFYGKKTVKFYGKKLAAVFAGILP